MTRFAWSILLCVVLPVAAVAQWETPNRSFHKPPVFPLDGRHLTVPCESCHLNGQTKGTPTLCAECHWVRRQDDPYRTRLGSECSQCHRTSSWTAVRWDHGAATGMALNAAHKTVGCETCHRGRLFTGASPECATCHMKEYDAARTPDHRVAGFPTTCDACHKASDVTFSQGRFEHAALFPLVGLHAAAACAACHAGGVFAGAPRDCVGCHRTAYDRTTKPNHAAAGFSTVCEGCHRPTDASFSNGQAFNHSGVFPLVGVHATQSCASCHVNGIFKGTARNCVGCHRSKYDRTTNPNHVSAQFPTSCDTCHRATDTSWSQGRFTHTWFPITSGPHRNRACNECHTNPSSYAQFTCTTCHGRSQMDSEHRNRSGYAYDSNRCYACHPTGRGD